MSAPRPFLLFILAAVAPAQPPPTRPDLTSMSLEDLMQIEVTSVSKKGQKLSRAAAAIYVLTQEEIRRSGHYSLAEALRMVPGLQVARIDANKWAITARGFAGQYSNKLLVLIDGRSVYTPAFSGVYWDLQDIPLEDVDRIEVIRGPGATLWGANAVNGVINILTKHSRDTQGGLATVGAGNEEGGSGYLRYGGRAGGRAYYRAYTRYAKRGHLHDSSGRNSADKWDSLRGGFRLDWDASPDTTATFIGDLYSVDSGQRLNTYLLRPPYSQVVDDQKETTGGYFLARWTHTFSDRSNLAFQVYYDRYERKDLLIGEARDTVDVDFQHRYRFSSRHEFVWGGGLRVINEHMTDTSLARITPNRRLYNLSNFFAEDEIALVPDRLLLTLGSKLEHNVFTAFEVQPTARLLWTPSDHHSAWASVSRAVRTPSRGESDAKFDMAATPGPLNLPVLIRLTGNPELRADTVVAHEAGYRFQLTERLSCDLAAFYNLHRRLVGVYAGTPVADGFPPSYFIAPLRLGNDQRADTYGLELAAHWNVLPRWKFSGSYTGLRVNLHPVTGVDRSSIQRSPGHQFQVHSYLDVNRSLQFDTGFYYVGPLVGIHVPRHTRTDARLGWRPAANLELSVGGQNLFGPRPLEFVSEVLTVSSLVGRTAYGRIGWRF